MVCIIFGVLKDLRGKNTVLEGWWGGGGVGAMFCTLSYFWDNCADNTSIYSKLNFSSPPAG